MSNIKIYFTRAQRTNKKIDIIRLDLENETFMVFKDIKDCDADDIFGYDGYDYYIERFCFDELSSLAQIGNFKEIKRIIEENDAFLESEKFYTHAQDDDYLVDLLKVYTNEKKYTLLTDQASAVADGYTELGVEWSASYVSREIFNAIVSGLAVEKYSRTSPPND